MGANTEACGGLGGCGRAARPRSAPKRALQWAQAAALLPGLVVALVGADAGGFFPRSWGWSAIALAALAGFATLARERIHVGRPEALTFGALATMAVWIALSSAWSSSPSNSLLEAERSLIYVAGLGGAALIVQRRTGPALLAGVLGGVVAVAVYGLVTRLFPSGPIVANPFEGTLLIEPLGYANALGIVAALGILLTLTFAAHARSSLARAVPAAVLPLLLATLFLTESRGALLALAAGLVVAVAFDARRDRFLATTAMLAVPAGLAVWLTSRAHALRTEQATVAELARQGHRLALVLVVLAVVAAASTFGADRAAALMRRRRRAFIIAAAALAAGLAPVVVKISAPSGFAGDRPAYWHVAWRDVEANPVLGSGAGTFADYWQRHRPTAPGVQDAHSLYLETLAEVGPLGLGLLVVGLGTPLAAAAVARRHRLVPGAAGAYFAYLIHTGLDWDWEMPAVTLAALLCAAVLLTAARHEGSGWWLSPAFRTVLVAGAAVVGSLALAGLVHNGGIGL
jgi:O-antigen ligase/polysaccharide polymerase Wzy-like membrane protein